MSDLTSSPELFDSRDVIERIEELESIPLHRTRRLVLWPAFGLHARIANRARNVVR